MTELIETHGSKFAAAKYACWVHCIQNGKHSSMDMPSLSSPVERKVAVSVIAQALFHLDQGLLPGVLIYALSASTS